MSKIPNPKLKKQTLIGLVFIAFLTAGWYFPIFGFIIPACMAFGISISFSKGRKWCEWYCPRGSFYDSALKFISPQKNIPALFKNLPLRIAILTLLFSMMTLQIIDHGTNAMQIGKFFMTLLTATTAIGIILGVIFHQRTWCYLCPVGTAANLIGKDRYKLIIDTEKCVRCKLCNQTCPMQLQPYELKSNDCIKCGDCINSCPKTALSFEK